MAVVEQLAVCARDQLIDAVIVRPQLGEACSYRGRVP